MSDIVFQVDIEGEQASVLRALTTKEGIQGWWTADANVPAGLGETMTLGFAMAPLPFELRVDEAGPERVRWAFTGAFPPHWANTSIEWRLSDLPEGGGTRVDFRHANWAADEGGLGMSALTWGKLMLSLKGLVETGVGEPLPS